MNKKTIVKGIGFFLVFLLLFGYLSQVFVVKDISENGNQEKYIAENLYALEEDSLDVLILGSSQVAFGVSPVEMYDHSGLSAFSIGMSQASMMSNYYWMLEACKRQNPSVVLMDVSCLFEVSQDSSERKSADSMRMSPNKLALIRAVTDQNGESLLSYLIPMIKYHDRWNALTEADFGHGWNSDVCYRGLNITDKCKKGLRYDQMIIDNDDPEANVRELYDYQREYFDRIVAYCQEKGMELVLFKTPKTSWTASDYAQVQELADSYGLDYMDFNQEAMLEAIGYDITTDMKDRDHMNTYGADKLSDYLADYLVERFALPDRREDPDYDLQINRELYNTERTDAYLCSATDPLEWLALLKEHSPCDVFISTKGNVGGKVSDELAALLADLGLETDLNELEPGEGFVGWLSNNTSVQELVETGYARIKGDLENGVEYEIVSRNQEDWRQSRAVIADTDRSLNETGLNILVYDEEQDLVIESVAFSLENLEEMQCKTRSD